jgi:hypothetical protein
MVELTTNASDVRLVRTFIFVLPLVNLPRQLYTKSKIGTLLGNQFFGPFSGKLQVSPRAEG